MRQGEETIALGLVEPAQRVLHRVLDSATLTYICTHREYANAVLKPVHRVLRFVAICSPLRTLRQELADYLQHRVVIWLEIGKLRIHRQCTLPQHLRV